MTNPDLRAEIEAVYEQTQRSIDEYRRHPFGDRRLGDKPERRGHAGEGCRVTVWHEHRAKPRAIKVLAGFYNTEHRCGEPVVSGGLCARHAADKVRLGGAS